MGYIRHNAIVVTSWDEGAITAAVAEAHLIGLTVIWQSQEGMNGYRSLLICPDGSKEGWNESDEGNKRRRAFRAWLNEQRYADGSSSLEWFEAAYGHDDDGVEIVASVWS